MNLFKTLFVLMVVALILGAGSQLARATQNPPCSNGCNDVYSVDYFANANTAGAPDATVRITNPGIHSEKDILDECAMVFVFDANQEMSECCGCFVSGNGLLTLSVNKDLTANPLLGAKLKTGVIKIVSAEPIQPCDPTDIDHDDFDTPDLPNNAPEPAMRVWATHIQNKVGAAFPITEGESQAAVLGAGELADLAEDCKVLLELGSGAGQCNCPPGH